MRALVVDHGLRDGSGAEAARVVGWLATHGIPCRLLAWAGPRPASRIQEAARAARHALLEAACAESGILHLLLAHHADDQRETVLMRGLRRSGPDGLAGMAVIRETGRIRLLRPLLGVAKARLLATLRAHGQPWLEDPSNLAPSFERGRLRRAPVPDGPEPARVAEAGRERAVRERADARLAARALRPDLLDGSVRLDAEELSAVPPDAVLRLLRRAIATIGRRSFPPAPAAVRRLLHALVEGDSGRRSLGGCLITRRPAVLTIGRERRRGSSAAATGPVLAGAPFAPMLLEGLPGLCMMGAAASASARCVGGCPSEPRRAIGEGSDP